MKKRGISPIVAMVLIILLVIAALMLLWIALLPLISNWIYVGDAQAALYSEDFRIDWIDLIPGEGSAGTLDIVLDRGSSVLVDFEIENITVIEEVEEHFPTDVMLLIDMSDSMGIIDPLTSCLSPGGDNLDYPGSYCNSREIICQAVNYCNGTYIDGECVGAIGPKKDASCVENTLYCGHYCGGIYTGDSRLYTLRSSTSVFLEAMLDANSDNSISLAGFSMVDTPSNYFVDFTGDIDSLNNSLFSWNTVDLTYLQYGLLKSQEVFAARNTPEKQHVLVVLGDGALTGSTGEEESLTIAEDLSDLGIIVHTIGFGTGADLDFFQELAEAGGGRYFDSSNSLDLVEIYQSIMNEVETSRIVKRTVQHKGVYIDFVFSSKGNSYSHRVTALPDSNGARRYEIELKEGWNAEDIDRVDIYLTARIRGRDVTAKIASRKM
jgi:hypothetical protein